MGMCGAMHAMVVMLPLPQSHLAPKLPHGTCNGPTLCAAQLFGPGCGLSGRPSPRPRPSKPCGLAFPSGVGIYLVVGLLWYIMPLGGTILPYGVGFS
jgi:hypothetical protein